MAKPRALTDGVLHPEVVGGWTLSAEARHALDDLWYFLTTYLGLQLEELPHREVIGGIEKAMKGQAGNTLVVIPRGFFKTTIAAGSLVWAQYRQVFLFEDFYHRVCIASATLSLGEQVLKRIEGILRGGGKNQRLFHNFPCKLWKDRKWGGKGSDQPDGIVLAPRLARGEDPGKPEPNFWVGSLRRVSTGFHADRAFLDDLNNRDNVQTPFQRAKVQDYFELIQPILVQQDEHGQRPSITYTCTPWHDDDVRGRIEKAEEKRRALNPDAPHEWEIIKFGAFLPDGSSRFPSRFPLEVLEKLRRDLSTGLFSANYLCDPVGDSAFVHENLIKFRDPATFPELVQLRAAFDPNQHREAKGAGCYAAGAVAGFDRFAKMYVLDAFGSRTWSTEQFLEALFETREKYPTARILIEDAHMAHFEHVIRLEEGRRSVLAGHPVRLRVTWVPVPRNMSKYQRYEKLEPRHRAHAIYYSDAIHPDIKMELVNELVRGDKAQFQDFLDVLAMADTGVKVQLDSSGQPVAQPQKKGEPWHPPTAAEAFGGEMFR